MDLDCFQGGSHCIFLKIWIPERVWAGGMWRAQAYTSHGMIRINHVCRFVGKQAITNNLERIVSVFFPQKF